MLPADFNLEANKGPLLGKTDNDIANYFGPRLAALRRGTSEMVQQLSGILNGSIQPTNDMMSKLMLSIKTMNDLMRHWHNQFQELSPVMGSKLKTVLEVDGFVTSAANMFAIREMMKDVTRKLEAERN